MPSLVPGRRLTNPLAVNRYDSTPTGREGEMFASNSSPLALSVFLPLSRPPPRPRRPPHSGVKRDGELTAGDEERVTERSDPGLASARRASGLRLPKQLGSRHSERAIDGRFEEKLCSPPLTLVGGNYLLS